MAWIWLIVAGLLEVAWAVGLKDTAGFTRPGASGPAVLPMLASFRCLARAINGRPPGPSYAIWTGIGAVGTALVGILVFKEPATAARLACPVLVAARMVGLKFMANG